MIARSAPSSPAPSARRDAALGLDRSARPSKPGDRAANGSYGAARLSDSAGFLTYLRALPTGTRFLHAASARRSGSRSNAAATWLRFAAPFTEIQGRQPYPIVPKIRTAP